MMTQKRLAGIPQGAMGWKMDVPMLSKGKCVLMSLRERAIITMEM